MNFKCVCFGEVLFDLLLGEGVARLQQFFRCVGEVPGFERFQSQLLPGECAQFVDVLLGIRPGERGAAGQLLLRHHPGGCGRPGPGPDSGPEGAVHLPVLTAAARRRAAGAKYLRS